MATQAAAPPKLTPQQQDAMATATILANAVNKTQSVANAQVFPATNPTLFIQPVNVGLIKRFIIIVTGTITNTGSTTITLTDFGVSNVFGPGGVQYSDLSNFLRVNTAGLHLSVISDAKRGRPYAGTYDANQVDGNNRSQMLNTPAALWPVITAQPTIASGQSGAFRAVFELPLAYSDTDLRGGIWANVLNAVQQLNLTFNTNVVTANPTDNTFAIYSGAAGSAGAISSATVVVYQQYLDQLPTGQAYGFLPQLSISTAYQLLYTNFANVTPGQEFPIQYANQRSFLSTLAIFNSTGAVGGRNYGSDVNYWALLTANSSYVWKLDPLTCTQESRDDITFDLPAGTYYFPSREHPIASQQFGNIQLILNAISANASSTVFVGWEQFALKNTLITGSSLAAN